MKLRHLAIAAVALFVPFFATACGSDSTGNYSEKEISEKFQDAGIDKKTADCLAPKVKDADLSESEIDEFNDNPNEDTKAGKALMSAVTECMGLETGS